MIQTQLVTSPARSSSQVKTNQNTAKASPLAKEASQQKCTKAVPDLREAKRTNNTLPNKQFLERQAAPIESATAKPMEVLLGSPRSSRSSEGAASVPIQAVSSAFLSDSLQFQGNLAHDQGPADLEQNEGPNAALASAKSQEKSQAAGPSPSVQAPACAISEQIEDQVDAFSPPKRLLSSASLAAACIANSQSQVSAGRAEHSFAEEPTNPSTRSSLPEGSALGCSSILVRNRRSLHAMRGKHFADNLCFSDY